MLESFFKAMCRIDNDMPQSIDVSDSSKVVDGETRAEDSLDTPRNRRRENFTKLTNPGTEPKGLYSTVSETRYKKLDERCETLSEYNLILQERLSKCIQALKNSRQDRDCAQEQLRRQTEILEGCQVDLRTALKENTGLVFQLSNLKKWTDSLNDDEATDMMRHANMGLEMWIEYHFNQNSPGKTRKAADPINHLGLFYKIYASVANCVFEGFLSNAMVGVDEPSLCKSIQIMDDEVQKQCPEHVRQHWRSATSTVLSSLGEQGLEARYEHVIRTLEVEYSAYSMTDPEKRRGQLKAVLNNFVQLKLRLERQVDQYFFDRILPDTPFCKDRMTSLTGGCYDNEIVEYNLSPILYKISSGCQLTLVEKANVKTRFILNQSPTDSSPGEDSYHNFNDVWKNHQLFK